MNFNFPEKRILASLPTPLQKLEKISAQLGKNIWMKRDDQTGFEWSGNKIRKLEYLAQDAVKSGATCLITCGGIQSNHCRATAAVAAKLGLRCVLFLRGQEPEIYSANFLLDRILGAEIFYLTNDQYYHGIQDFRATIDAQIRAQGGKTYFIPEGGSNGLGCFGYAQAMQEITEQSKSMHMVFDSIFVSHGSGGTQAGLILGKLGLSDCNTEIFGVNVCYDAKESYRLTKEALWQAIQQYKLPLSFAADDIKIVDGYVGKGYAQSTDEELKFLVKIAREEAVLLDPVYTGKAFLGMYDSIKKNPHSFGQNILFVHTGGGFGNFKMEKEWAKVV